ncbi:hypothetical protein [Streptococcus pantholopis]|uniref:YCII-related domain-containing protein n=1 Tax=Streptococcus pantholopis TaxID=1811193 RepID=A0A172Q5F7_9STRE|nr:hypothetical protein [Streptococcus pantholopis]AND78699.1 hypothetical protein A0O21_00980 [Streptococcus pantholopis]
MNDNAKKMAEKPIETNAFLISTQLKNVEISPEILEKEYEVSNRWHEEGLIENLFARVENDALGGGILVMRVKTLEEAEARMSELPLAPYFEKIDYEAIDKIY